jgi:cytochrome b561
MQGALQSLQSKRVIKQVAVSELVFVSIILFLMIIYRITSEKGSEKGSDKFVNSIKSSVNALMGESELAHTCLYVLLFSLVLSSVIMIFFSDDDKNTY